MTSFTLSGSTQALINLALNSGDPQPGTDNINYVNAYQAIYAELVANGSINAGTLVWFSMADDVNRQQSQASSAGAFIWEYTKAAAASEGATLTDGDLQEASNAIAVGVFQRLVDNGFVFDDANTVSGFAPNRVRSLDASVGLQSLQNVDPNLDNAIWGGTLFARTMLGDADYFAETGVQLEPNSPHAKAMIRGLVTAAAAVLDGGGSITSDGVSGLANLDWPAILASLSDEEKAFVGWTFAIAGPELTVASLAAVGATYLWSLGTGGLASLTTDDEDGSALYVDHPNAQAFIGLDYGTFGDLGYEDGVLTTALKNLNGDVIGSLVVDENGVGHLYGPGGLLMDLPGAGVIHVTRAGDEGIDLSLLFNNGNIWMGHIDDEGAFSTEGTFNTLAFPDGDPTTVAGYTSSLVTQFNQRVTDPLVLDLSSGGTGVELISIEDSGAQFDLNADSFTEETGWVGSDTGFLVKDNNSNGQIDNITEMFGNDAQDGFTALKALDINSDNAITAADGSNFTSLRIWKDADGDGVTDAGELKTLAEHNIVEIGLNAQAVRQEVNGNIIGAVGSFLRANGTTGQVAEAFFRNDRMNSTFTGEYDLNPATLLMPNVRGYGTMAPLYIAMSMDEDLLELVEEFTATPLEDAGTLTSQVTDILYQWAGVDEVDPESRGDWIDARTLGVLETFMGNAYVSANGAADPSQPEGIWLQQGFETLRQAVAARLMVQGPLASLFPDVEYDFNTDALTGTADFTAVFEALGELAHANNAAAAEYWTGVLPILTALARDLGVATPDYNDDLEAVLRGVFTGGLPLTVDGANDVVLGSTGNDTIGAASMGDSIVFGGAGDDSINVNYSSGTGNDYVSGGDGADTIYGNFGNDVIDGGAGNDTIDAGQGNDTIYGGDGNDTIEANGGADVVSGGGGNDTFKVFSGQVVAGETMDGGDGTDRILLPFGGVDISAATGMTGVEEIALASGSTITLSAGQFADIDAFTNTDGPSSGNIQIQGARAGTYDLSGKTLTSSAVILLGSAGNDTLGGTSRNDTLNGKAGNDIINGGSGNETIYGEDNDDTINGGDGNDTIDGGAGNDTIEGGDGNDTIEAGFGADAVSGGDGDDIIKVFTNWLGTGTVAAGETVDGGAGYDKLVLQNSSVDISGMASITNMEELSVPDGQTVTVGSGQLDAFSAIVNSGNPTGNLTIAAASAGSYSLAGKTITAGTIVLAGSNGADTLTGSAAGDVINGNGGDDIIEGGAGNDTMEGGWDVDTITYANAGSAVTVDLSNSSAQNTGGAGTDTIQNFDNLTGSAYNDTLTGNSSANVILGGAGNDTLDGGGGNDTLDGGLGTNSLIGGTGNDTYKLERTYGASEITENDSTGGNTDVLQLGADVARDQLWFTQSGNDLVVQVIGTGAQMTIQDWYSGSDYQVEQIKTSGNDVLSNSNVQNLVNAMSSLSVPETTTLSTEYHTALDSTIAANWA